MKEKRLTWINTNSLLQLGYEGVKTGWIPNVHNQALWCNLAALYNHQGKDILCITIGSENQALRFCDMHYLVGLYV